MSRRLGQNNIFEGMILTRKRAACAAIFAFAATTAAVPAHALTTYTKTIDLNGTGTASGSSYGNSRTYQISVGSGSSAYTVSMRATAWSWTGTTLRSAYLGTYDKGLGVTNRNETGSNNTHTVDNQSGFDFIVFQFDRNVQLTGVTANAFALGGSTDNDLTVGRSISSNTNGWDGKAVSNLSTLFQAQKNIDSSTTKGALDAVRVLNPAGSSVVQGKVWMISASLKNSDNKIDAFKLDSLKFQTNSAMGILGPIPEPATWAMMISGFGLIGATLRRRRTMASARFI